MSAAAHPGVPTLAVVMDGADDTQAGVMDCSAAASAPSSAPTASSWHPVNLGPYLDGSYEPPRPTHLERDDGVNLLYAGETHELFGESESGKSWVALYATAQALARGGTVVYLDFEASPGVVTDRLLRLGVDPADVADRFVYVHPDAPLTDQRSLDSSLDHTPTLVVIDGVTDAMSLHGLNPNDNADNATFDRLLPRAIANTGPAVVSVDHVTKSPLGDAKYAIGGQHKRAMVSGASYRVDNVKPFAPGRHGISKLTIAKDRHGAVRQVAVSVAAEFHLDATDPDHVSASLRAPQAATDATGRFRPTVLMERVSRALEDLSPDGLAVRRIYDAVPGKKDAVTAAVKCLRDEGYVTVTDGPRNAKIHRSQRPYRDDDAHDRPPHTDDDRATVPPALQEAGDGGRSQGDHAEGDQDQWSECPNDGGGWHHPGLPCLTCSAKAEVTA